MTAGKVSAEVTQKSMQGANMVYVLCTAKDSKRKCRNRRQRKAHKKYQTGDKSASKAIQQVGKDYDKHSTVCGGKPVVWIVLLIVLFDGSYCRCNWCCDWFGGAANSAGRLYLSGTGLGTDGVLS